MEEDGCSSFLIAPLKKAARVTATTATEVAATSTKISPIKTTAAGTTATTLLSLDC